MRYLGVVITFLIVVAAMKLGESTRFFLDIPSLLFVTSIPMLLLGVSYGFQGLKEFFELFVSFGRAPTQKPKSIDRKMRLLRSYIAYTYAAGLTGSSMGAIAILSSWDNLVVGNATAFSIALLTAFYALIINELQIRPILHGLKDLGKTS